MIGKYFYSFDYYQIFQYLQTFQHNQRWFKCHVIGRGGTVGINQMLTFAHDPLRGVQQICTRSIVTTPTQPQKLGLTQKLLNITTTITITTIITTITPTNIANSHQNHHHPLCCLHFVEQFSQFQFFWEVYFFILVISQLFDNVKDFPD